MRRLVLSAFVLVLSLMVSIVQGQEGPQHIRSLDPIVEWLKSFHVAYPLVGILVLLMGIDVLIGFCAAFITKTISSTICSTGMVKKVMILLLVGVCAAIEPYAGDLPLSKLASMAFIVFEVTSIVENCARAGLPIPEVITSTLAKLKAVDKTPTLLKSESQSHVNIQRADRVDVVDIHTSDGSVRSDSKVVKG